MSSYTATIRWARKDDGDFTKGQYSRAHEWAFDGGVTVPASPSPHGSLIRIPCADLRHKTFTQVDKELKDNGFLVKKVERPGGREGDVLDVQPCEAQRGSEITVTVATGKGGPGPTNVPTTPDCFGGGLIFTCPPTNTRS